MGAIRIQSEKKLSTSLQNLMYICSLILYNLTHTFGFRLSLCTDDLLLV